MKHTRYESYKTNCIYYLSLLEGIYLICIIYDFERLYGTYTISISLNFHVIFRFVSNVFKCLNCAGGYKGTINNVYGP